MDPSGKAGAMESSRLVPEPSFDSFAGLARHVTIAGFAGVFTGILVGGIGGRLFMRLAGAAAPEIAQGRRTEAGFTVGEITFGGSLGLVLFIGIFTGIVGAILFVVFRPWMAWARRWRGVLFGVVLFAIGSATSDVMNPDNIDFRILENPVLLVAAIFFLFVVFGLVIDAAFRFLDQRMPSARDGSGSVNAPYIVFALIGLLAVVAVLPGFFSETAFCSCQPPILASVAMLLSGLGTLVWWATALFSVMPSLSRIVSAILGYTGVAGVLIFGLSRAISDAIEIIA